MRHSRSKSFDAALAAPSADRAGARHWTDDASDPNDPRALVRRAEVLRAAWRPAVADRGGFIVERCTGKSVLDIGCVAHDVARMSSPWWMHGRIAGVASACVGVDVLVEGVEQMRHLGFDAVVHDLRDGLGPLAERGPFDVIVAGELIEHVEAIDMLFATAALVLAPSGEMIITTPNPYSTDRVRAGQRGLVWENVDHILYAFPSGIAELCERHGLRLAEAATTSDGSSSDAAEWLRRARRWLRGQQWVNVGVRSQGARGVARTGGPWPSVASRFGRRSRFVGETFVYVVRRA